SRPTRSTSTPLAASACAWYRMRALRPRSPSATTTALIEEGSVTGRSSFYPRRGAAPKQRQQIGRDAPAILGRGADVVDRRNLGEERPLRVLDRRARGERRLGPGRPDHGRRNAAEGDSRPIV